MPHRLLEDLTNRNRKDSDAAGDDDHLISFEPVACAIRRGNAEYKFFELVFGIRDRANPTSVPVFPVFDQLVGRYRNGRIVDWDILPFKERAPSGFKGYSFVIDQMFLELGQIYKFEDGPVRSDIRQALALAKEVLEGRIRDVERKGHRNQDVRGSHLHVIKLWTEAIKKLEQVLEECEGTAGAEMDYRNDHEHGGSGNGAQRSSDRENYRSQPTKSAKPVSSAQFRRCRDEYQGGRPGNSYQNSTTHKAEVGDVGTRVVAATGAVAAGGIGVGVVLNSMAATAGAAKTAALATAFAGTSAGQAIAIGTMVLGAPAVLLPSAVVAGLLLKYALWK